MAWTGLVLSILLIFAAVAILLQSRRWQRQSGLPEGQVVYTDDGLWMPNSDVLHDRQLRLAGRPDYLVEQKDGLIIPVEIKSAPAPEMPYAGHVLQLIAYCRLVESEYGIRPTHGILQYNNRAFSIAYTATLEQDLLDTLADMRNDQAARNVPRDHHDPRRCVSCGFRDICDFRLA